MRNAFHALASTVTLAILLSGVPVQAGGSLVSLEETYQPFADHFNETAEKVRFVAILSPT